MKLVCVVVAVVEMPIIFILNEWMNECQILFSEKLIEIQLWENDEKWMN